MPSKDFIRRGHASNRARSYKACPCSAVGLVHVVGQAKRRKNKDYDNYGKRHIRISLQYAYPRALYIACLRRTGQLHTTELGKTVQKGRWCHKRLPPPAPIPHPHQHCHCRPAAHSQLPRPHTIGIRALPIGPLLAHTSPPSAPEVVPFAEGARPKQPPKSARSATKPLRGMRHRRCCDGCPASPCS
jgi:hypothetical protein